MVIYSIGTVYLTFEETDSKDSTMGILVSLLSLCNFFGRLLFGLLSDRLYVLCVEFEIQSYADKPFLIVKRN